MWARMKNAESYYVLSTGCVEDGATLTASMEAGNGEVVVVGVGRSMEPTILSGDGVLLRGFLGAPRLGWIVVYPFRGRILTHRVVKTSGGVFWGRGDAGVEVEGPVDASKIIGRLVGYWRDGRWCSLDGYKGIVAGLVYNVTMSKIRLAAKRWPGLRQLIETEFFGAGVVRDGYSKIGEWLFGRVVVEEETSLDRIIGVVVSDTLPLAQHLVEQLKDGTRAGDLHLFVAHTSRRRWVGNVLLTKARLTQSAPAGYVSNLLVMLGFRGMGIGGRLLSAVEDAARRDGLGRLVALVEPGNVRSMRAFLAAGYRRVGGEELAGRSEEERKSVPAGKVLLEKVLCEV